MNRNGSKGTLIDGEWITVSNEPLYDVWTAMKQRCLNHNCKQYKDYGGRGIGICEEWARSYRQFREWANQNGYERGLSIDRIDNNGGYSPQNCRWVDRKTQQNNTRRNVYIEFNGQTLSLSEWSKKLGLYRGAVGARLRKGWSIEDALTIGKTNDRPHQYSKVEIAISKYLDGNHSVKQISDITGIPMPTIYSHIKRRKSN